MDIFFKYKDMDFYLPEIRLCLPLCAGKQSGNNNKGEKNFLVDF